VVVGVLPVESVDAGTGLLVGEPVTLLSGVIELIGKEGFAALAFGCFPEPERVDIALSAVLASMRCTLTSVTHNL
jgi:hypothetical protein